MTVLISNLSFAQKTCGADEILKKNLSENPEKVIIRDQLNQFTKEFETLYVNTAKMDQNYILFIYPSIIDIEIY